MGVRIANSRGHANSVGVLKCESPYPSSQRSMKRRKKHGGEKERTVCPPVFTTESTESTGLHMSRGRALNARSSLSNKRHLYSTSSCESGAQTMDALNVTTKKIPNSLLASKTPLKPRMRPIFRKRGGGGFQNPSPNAISEIPPHAPNAGRKGEVAIKAQCVCYLAPPRVHTGWSF